MALLTVDGQQSSSASKNSLPFKRQEPLKLIFLNAPL
jgi:hypothetical protein